MVSMESAVRLLRDYDVYCIKSCGCKKKLVIDDSKALLKGTVRSYKVQVYCHIACVKLLILTDVLLLSLSVCLSVCLSIALRETLRQRKTIKGNIEFRVELAGKTVLCPDCPRQETRLMAQLMP